MDFENENTIWEKCMDFMVFIVPNYCHRFGDKDESTLWFTLEPFKSALRNVKAPLKMGDS